MDEFVTDNIGVIISGSVRFLSKKNNQTEKEKKRDPKPNRTRPKPAGSDSFPVWFFSQKTGQTYMHFLSCFWTFYRLFNGQLLNACRYLIYKRGKFAPVFVAVNSRSGIGCENNPKKRIQMSVLLTLLKNS